MAVQMALSQFRLWTNWSSHNRKLIWLHKSNSSPPEDLFGCGFACCREGCSPPASARWPSSPAETRILEGCLSTACCWWAAASALANVE